MTDMGKTRQFDRHLPPRMRLRGRVYYHVYYFESQQKWVKLSDNYADAIALYYQREGVQPAGTTVGDALSRYENEILPGKADTTQREYKRYIAKLRETFGDCRLSSVRRSDVAQYLDRRSAKIEGNREVACFSSVYQSAIRWGWTDENPCRGAPRNTEKRRMRLPADAELNALRLAASEQMQCMIDLVLLTGLRKSDLLKIRLSDLTEQGLRITIQKTGVAAVFIWTDALREVVNTAKSLRRRVGTFYLFATRAGQPYTSSGFDSIWQRLTTRAEIKEVTFHDLRRWAITQAERQGGLDYAQAVGAHKSRQATERYIVPGERIIRPLK